MWRWENSCWLLAAGYWQKVLKVNLVVLNFEGTEKEAGN
jgi:hypothetical protein